MQLVNVLAKGSKDRNMDEGLEGIFNAVIYAIDIAETGNKSDLLHMFDDFETKYQDDHYAFDQKLWNELMKYLKALAREVLNKAQ